MLRVIALNKYREIGAPRTHMLNMNLCEKIKKNSYGPCKLVTSRQIIKEKPYKSYKHNIIYFSVFI
jgi:hypothetical protein